MSTPRGPAPEERMVYLLLVVSTVLTTCAVIVERLYANDADVSAEAVVLIAAGSLTMMTVALVRACWQRGRRESRQFRMALDRIAWGSLVYYPGAALSLLAHQWLGPEPGSAIRVFSQLLALPLIVLGMVGLLWPPRFSKAQARVLVADALVGALGLTVLWLLLIYPVALESAAAAGTSRVWAMSEATMLLFGSALVLVLISASRRRSALPGRQVWLVHGALISALVAGIADVLLEPRGLAGISVFLIGDLLGIAFLCVFCLQPSMQPEAEWESRAREIYASVGPLVPIPLACVALVGAMARDPADSPSHATMLGGILLIFLLISVVVLRALASAELRGAARERSDSGLSNSTEEEWFQVLVGRTADLTLVLHRDGGIAYATPSVYRATGLGPMELRGRAFSTLLSPDPVNQRAVGDLISGANALAGEPTEPMDLLLRSSTGGREVEWQVTALVGLDMEGYLVHGRDVTDERRMAALLAESVSLDALTGLHNRHGFLVAGADRRGKRCVLAINLRRFSDFNDQHGHAAGDQVLRHLAQVLRDLPGPVQESARLSADTFALLVTGSVPDIEVVSAAASIRQAMRLITLADGRPLPLDVAAGYAVSETEDMPIDELLSRAELAMSRSRSLERSPLVRYEPNLRVVRDAAAAAEADLRTALRERSLVVRYQPIVRLSDGAVVAAEALVRRRRADGSLESPEVFIPLAEQLGFVDEVDQAVLMRALGEMQEIAAQTGRQLPVSVNISASELDDGLEHRILEALGQTGWSAENLIIEVTETALATRTDEASRLLRRLQLAGCRVAMDDFGTGYSSMASLVEMPVDIVKIDASFTHRLTAAGRGLSVMRAIVEIGRSLNLVTVAEGLATMEQADLLRGMGCDRGQGYLYAPPLSAADLADYLRPDKDVIVVD